MSLKRIVPAAVAAVGLAFAVPGVALATDKHTVELKMENANVAAGDPANGTVLGKAEWTPEDDLIKAFDTYADTWSVLARVRVKGTRKEWHSWADKGRGKDVAARNLQLPEGTDVEIKVCRADHSSYRVWKRSKGKRGKNWLQECTKWTVAPNPNTGVPARP